MSVVYYVAAMLQATPENAVQLQMSVLMWLRSTFSKTLFYFTMCRLVPEYWDWALQEQLDHGPLEWRSSGQQRVLAATALATIAALLTAGLFEYNFGDSEVLMLFLIIVSLPAAAARTAAA